VALLPGIQRLPDLPACARALAMVSAGTTPWVCWPFALTALSLGWDVLLKDSADMPDAGSFLRSMLVQASPSWARRLHCLGTDHSAVGDAISRCDAAVVYGSDRSVEFFRSLCAGKRFLGFPHAVSCAIWEGGGPRQLRGLLADLLMYRQLGCLSPQVCFVLGGASEAADLVGRLAGEADRICRRLEVGEILDASVALRIREWRDVQGALGSRVECGDGFRWSIAAVPPGFGPTWDCAFGVLPIVAVAGMSEIDQWISPVQQTLSSIGVSGAGALRNRLKSRFSGIRIAGMGRMQCPGLHWKNGGIDPAAWLGWL